MIYSHPQRGRHRRTPGVPSPFEFPTRRRARCRLRLLALVPALWLTVAATAASPSAGANGTPIDECLLVVENAYCGHSLQRTDGTLLGVPGELDQDPGTWIHVIGTLTAFECSHPCAVPTLQCLEIDDVLLCDHGTAFCFGDGSEGPCPCGNEGSTGRGCENTTPSDGARLRTGGAPEVGHWMELYLDGLPPGAPCVLFQGATLTSWPMHDGLLCLGPPYRRLATFTADASGAFRVPVVLSALAGAVPGDVDSFQVWYAEAAPSICGTGANLTNATRVDWIWGPPGG